MIMMGGITRLKYHLAKIPGHEVDICPNSTPEIMCIANKALDDMGLAREYKEAKKVQFSRGEEVEYLRREVQRLQFYLLPHHFLFLEPHLVHNLLSGRW
jgi:hypothetical protein